MNAVSPKVGILNSPVPMMATWQGAGFPALYKCDGGAASISSKVCIISHSPAVM